LAGPLAAGGLLLPAPRHALFPACMQTAPAHQSCFISTYQLLLCKGLHASSSQTLWHTYEMIQTWAPQADTKSHHRQMPYAHIQLESPAYTSKSHDLPCQLLLLLHAHVITPSLNQGLNLLHSLPKFRGQGMVLPHTCTASGMSGCLPCAGAYLHAHACSHLCWHCSCLE